LGNASIIAAYINNLNDLKQADITSIEAMLLKTQFP
jgi:hypothetical protein